MIAMDAAIQINEASKIIGVIGPELIADICGMEAPTDIPDIPFPVEWLESEARNGVLVFYPGASLMAIHQTNPDVFNGNDWQTHQPFYTETVDPGWYLVDQRINRTGNLLRKVVSDTVCHVSLKTYTLVGRFLMKGAKSLVPGSLGYDSTLYVRCLGTVSGGNNGGSSDFMPGERNVAVGGWGNNGFHVGPIGINDRHDNVGVAIHYPAP